MMSFPFYLNAFHPKKSIHPIPFPIENPLDSAGGSCTELGQGKGGVVVGIGFSIDIWLYMYVFI